MSPEEKPSTEERDQTDESLRTERVKADSDLEAKQAAIDDAADAIIEKARTRADKQLAKSRARSDRALPPLSAASAEVIEAERGREDETLRDERDCADETLRMERAAQQHIPSVERDETDKDLSHERARSDLALTARDAFLGIVSHDLRNLLAGMVGFAGSIANGASREGEDQIVGYAQRIQRSGSRMNRLIGDLVDVASIEAGMLAVSRECGDPALVVMEAVENFQSQADAKGITLETEIASPLPIISFDPARILQVLVNLLSNAIKFTPKDGTVVVRVDGVGDELSFAVSDTGEGIPPSKLEAVFDRFLQVIEHDRRGVGLGLYISKCIVQGHGGRIWAESRPATGSTFRFTLPAKADAR